VNYSCIEDQFESTFFVWKIDQSHLKPWQNLTRRMVPKVFPFFGDKEKLVFDKEDNILNLWRTCQRCSFGMPCGMGINCQGFSFHICQGATQRGNNAESGAVVAIRAFGT